MTVVGGANVLLFPSVVADDLAKIFTGSSTPFPVEITTSDSPAEDALPTPLDTPSATDSPVAQPSLSSDSAPENSTMSTSDELSETLQKSLDVGGSSSSATAATTRFPAGIQGSVTSSTPSPYFPSEPSPWHPPHPLFDLVQLGVDRRLVRQAVLFFFLFFLLLFFSSLFRVFIVNLFVDDLLMDLGSCLVSNH